MALLALAACSPIQLGSRTLDFGAPAQTLSPQTTMPAGPSQSFGRGPVKVALLLPLSGDSGLATVGQSLANASRLAIAFIEANPNIAENITITLRDTGSTVQGATAAASAAVTDGAKLILGPLRADQVVAAGSVARSAGLPLIGFSNNPTAAGPGVYLLSVLPDIEMKRSMGWLMAQGRRGIAGVFPATEFGQAQEMAFRQQAVAAGFAAQAVYTFSSVEEAQQIVNQALPEIQKGMIDTLFLPDRATAPSFGVLLAQAGISPDALQIVGSADWEGDPDHCHGQPAQRRDLSHGRPGRHAGDRRRLPAPVRNPAACSGHHRLYSDDPGQCERALHGQSALQSGADDRPFGLQWPRRGVPLPWQRKERVCAGHQENRAWRARRSSRGAKL